MSESPTQITYYDNGYNGALMTALLYCWVADHDDTKEALNFSLSISPT